MSEFDFLEEQGVSAALIKAAEEFRQEYGVSEEAKHRRIKPALPFYGKETLEMAMAAVLEQENLLLAGPKATGKNVLAENLAYIFGRPVYNVSFHVNTNSGDLIGTDTFVDNQVKLRKGSIYQCAEEGGFGILDAWKAAAHPAPATAGHGCIAGDSHRTGGRDTFGAAWRTAGPGRAPPG